MTSTARTDLEMEIDIFNNKNNEIDIKDLGSDNTQKLKLRLMDSRLSSLREDQETSLTQLTMESINKNKGVLR
jgi:hypothetical protein